MEKELITNIISNASFATLFVWLLWDTRKDSRERELKYQSTITSLVDKITIVEEIKEDVEAIKNKIFK
ncbi:BhlA/UviB family holin-like peptide [Clostridium gasigenes]|uniref:BhlA/UviB family holin-like peptide n=1 Tax=Clostridium gasigenes TaxID=94869 RepID=UPI001C0D0CB4|nr:BhlA/UviB family holin-like peptide [Clostridium gasigenes]MBU3109901.1 bacteriocin [Clostridium gasigenes]